MSDGTGYLYSQCLDQADLEALLETRREELTYVMQETDADIAFDEISNLNQPWPRGRAFGESLEVRWTQEAGRYHVVLLTETPQPNLSEEGWRTREGLTAKDEVRVYLWGRHHDFLREGQPEGVRHRWVQASIPRELDYPWSRRDEWVFLRVVEYSENAMVRLTRFKGLDGETTGGER